MNTIKIIHKLHELIDRLLIQTQIEILEWVLEEESD